MRPFLFLLGSVVATAAAMPRQQQQYDAVLTGQKIMKGRKEGVGHFSEWSRATKREFLIDWQAGKEKDWILVQGNEGGYATVPFWSLHSTPVVTHVLRDLDSMASALAWAFHIEHSTQNTSNPLKAIALLQTRTDALDFRPENKVALANSKMTSGHEDLLTIDELPEDPETLSPKLKGIVLVDHAVPQRKWRDAKILVGANRSCPTCSRADVK